MSANIKKDNVSSEELSEKSQNHHHNTRFSIGFHLLLPVVGLGVIIFGRKHIFNKILLQLDKKYLTVLCPSFIKRENILQWACSRLPPTWSSHSTKTLSSGIKELWLDGSLLCTLINTAVPGACPNPHRHWKQSPAHAQALAFKYFGIIPIFSNEDLNRNLSSSLEGKFIRYLNEIQQAINRISENLDKVKKFSPNYLVRGMGLYSGEQYKKTTFYIYPDESYDCEDEKEKNIIIQIKGPFGTYGEAVAPKLITKKRKRAENRTKQERRPSILFIENLQSNINNLSWNFTRAQKKNQNDAIEIKTTLENERIKVSYTPRNYGMYEINMISNGELIKGCPFNVHIFYNEFIEDKQEIKENKKKKTTKNNTPTDLPENDNVAEEKTGLPKLTFNFREVVDEITKNGAIFKTILGHTPENETSELIIENKSNIADKNITQNFLAVDEYGFTPREAMFKAENIEAISVVTKLKCVEEESDVQEKRENNFGTLDACGKRAESEPIDDVQEVKSNDERLTISESFSGEAISVIDDNIIERQSKYSEENSESLDEIGERIKENGSTLEVLRKMEDNVSNIIDISNRKKINYSEGIDEENNGSLKIYNSRLEYFEEKIKPIKICSSGPISEYTDGKTIDETGKNNTELSKPVSLGKTFEIIDVTDTADKKAKYPDLIDKAEEKIEQIMFDKDNGINLSKQGSDVEANRETNALIFVNKRAINESEKHTSYVFEPKYINTVNVNRIKIPEMFTNRNFDEKNFKNIINESNRLSGKYFSIESRKKAYEDMDKMEFDDCMCGPENNDNILYQERDTSSICPDHIVPEVDYIPMTVAEKRKIFAQNSFRSGSSWSSKESSFSENEKDHNQIHHQRTDLSVFNIINNLTESSSNETWSFCSTVSLPNLSLETDSSYLTSVKDKKEFWENLSSRSSSSVSTKSLSPKKMKDRDSELERSRKIWEKPDVCGTERNMEKVYPIKNVHKSADDILSLTTHLEETFTSVDHSLDKCAVMSVEERKRMLFKMVAEQEDVDLKKTVKEKMRPKRSKAKNPIEIKDFHQSTPKKMDDGDVGFFSVSDKIRKFNSVMELSNTSQELVAKNNTRKLTILPYQSKQNNNDISNKSNTSRVQAQFKKTIKYFKNLETKSHEKTVIPKKISNTQLPQDKENARSTLPKISQKFFVQNLYQDVFGSKRGSFKGTPNKSAVVEALATFPRNQLFLNDSEDDIRYEVFRRHFKKRKRKSAKSFFEMYS